MKREACALNRSLCMLVEWRIVQTMLQYKLFSASSFMSYEYIVLIKEFVYISIDFYTDCLLIRMIKIVLFKFYRFRNLILLI